jgi:uncharacterized DUF497 family protein
MLYRSYNKSWRSNLTRTKILVIKRSMGCLLPWQQNSNGMLLWYGKILGEDTRYEYGELRMIALAPETNVLYYVAFVDRGEIRRIISLRRANRREVKYYVENF